MAFADLCHWIVGRSLKREPASLRLLDFGCGTGANVRQFLALGYDAYGCDIGFDWPGGEGEWVRSSPATSWQGEIMDRLRPIAAAPYRLPFPDNSFDVVVSTSVFEHARNKETAFAEISRVLKPEGFGVHLIPAKWIFSEPHVFVPMVSWMWPNVPDWWLSFWAWVGVRNQFQKGLAWREVARLNKDYCVNGLHYWRLREYRALFHRTFGDYLSLDDSRLQYGNGRVARTIKLFRLGWIACPLRATFIEACIGHHNRRKANFPVSPPDQ